ncbi:hypothetical protein C2E23DRAFT_471477 [Lenzites betulinus]|nr:hypothetical protein C2E23DRAFT_471477 [Lenzites betulinus]
MALSLFWNRFGVENELDPMPESLGTWVADSGEPLEDGQQQLRLAVEKARSMHIVKLDLLATNNNLVVKAYYDDGNQDVVRTPCVVDNKLGLDPVLLKRFWRETNLLKWLKTRTAIPIPAVHCIIDSPRPEMYPYAVIEELPGTVVLNAFGRLPFSAKERFLHTYADVAIELFKLAVPQRIGSLDCREDGSIDVIPWRCILHAYSATKVYDTLEDFIDFLIQRKLRARGVENDEESRRRCERVLARLASELSVLTERLSRPAYRRCVLTHDDLNQANVLVNGEGAVTGVIDWEHQSVRPAVLGVHYPECIRYDALCDPRFTASENTFWTCSPQDAARLRERYVQIVTAKDHECGTVLVDGDCLRQAVEWLSALHEDSGCVALERWMDVTFTG